jgi:cell division septation protein DedD
VPTPKPARTVVAAAAIPEPAPVGQATGHWRVQLGAFAQEARARDAWAALQRDEGAAIGSAQPFYVAGANVVRLQLGSFSSAGDAGALCRQIKASGRACFVVEAN